MKKFNIWQEGYACTGDRAGASLAGQAEAETFREACIAYALENPTWGKYFDPERMTNWACRLFDNEKDARSSFG